MYSSYMRTLSAKSESPSAVHEDYIRAIYLLQEKGEDSGVVQIAKRLKLSKSTVSERIKDLNLAGYTESKPYSAVSLTKKGKTLGMRMTYKHRLIEVFLHEVLKLPANLIHEEAERLEHAFSDESIKRLEVLLNHPTHDPHGSLLPK